MFIFRLKNLNPNILACDHAEKTTCICFNNITIAARNVIGISIHARKRDNIKGNLVICPISAITRDKIINQVTKNNLTNPRTKTNLTTSQRQLQILIRMRYYIYTSSFLVKKQGTLEDLLAYILELDNLTRQLTEGRNHLSRLLEMYSEIEESNRAQLLQTETMEALLTGEWLSLLKQVKPNKKSLFFLFTCTHNYLNLLLLRAGDIETNPGPAPPRANVTGPTPAPFLFPPTQILLQPDTNINFKIPDIPILNIPKFDFQEFYMTPQGRELVKQRCYYILLLMQVT